LKWDGTTVYSAMNGGAFSSTAFAFLPQGTTGNLYLGANWNAGAPLSTFNGYLDGVSLWRGKVLTDVQWQNFYNAGVGQEYYSGAWHSGGVGTALDLPAPVAFFSMNGAAGETDTVGALSATVIGATPASVAGKIGNARAFVSAAANGANLQVADTPALKFDGRDFTVAVWFNLTQNNSLETMIVKGNEFNLTYDSGQSGLTATLTGTPNASLLRAGVIATGAWHLAVVWYDRTAHTLNLQLDNGTITSVAATTVIANQGYAFRLGGIIMEANYLDGILDAIAKWDVVLTSTQRTNLWNAGAGREYISGAWT